MSSAQTELDSRVLARLSVVESAVAEWRRTNPSGRLVFTNGCFDILHSGHVAYLQEARSLGDALFVGLNSDSSVRRLKGPERPVNDELARARVLSALRAVDLVGLFSEDTPLELIRRVRPDVLVKGGDWKKTAIVGWDFVESYGGQVRSLVFVDGFSTTGVIEKIRARS